jgi:hypothetical protein
MNTNNYLKRGDGSGNVILAVALIAIVLLVIFYGLPMMRGGGTQMNAPGTVNVNPPQ